MLSRRAISVVVVDTGAGDDLDAPDAQPDAVRRMRDLVKQLPASASAADVLLVHRHRSATALERWGLPCTPLAVAVVVDGVTTWSCDCSSELLAARAATALPDAVGAWSPDAEAPRAAEAALEQAAAALRAGEASLALEHLYGSRSRDLRLPLLDPAQQARFVRAAAHALAAVDDAATARLVLQLDEAAPVDATQAHDWLHAVTSSADRGAAATVLARWCQRFREDPALALAHAGHLLATGSALRAVGEARRARALLREGTSVAERRAQRETHHVAVKALMVLGRGDEALVELARLRSTGGWKEGDEAAYDRLREQVVPKALLAGRGRTADPLDAFVAGAFRLGRAVAGLVGGKARLHRRDALLADAPRLLRPEQVSEALALEAPPLVSRVSHEALYRALAADPVLLDELPEVDPSPVPDPATPALEPLPAPDGEPLPPARIASAREALADFGSWFRGGPLLAHLTVSGPRAARFARWALAARQAGLSPTVVSAFEAVAREDFERAQSLASWLDAQLAGDDDARSHAGWHAAAEATWLPAPDLEARYDALRSALLGE